MLGNITIALSPQLYEAKTFDAYSRRKAEPVSVMHALRLDIYSREKDDSDTKVEAFIQEHFKEIALKKIPREGLSSSAYKVMPESFKLLLDEIAILRREKGLVVSSKGTDYTLDRLVTECFLKKIEEEEYKKAFFS